MTYQVSCINDTILNFVVKYFIHMKLCMILYSVSFCSWSSFINLPILILIFKKYDNIGPVEVHCWPDYQCCSSFPLPIARELLCPSGCLSVTWWFHLNTEYAGVLMRFTLCKCSSLLAFFFFLQLASWFNVFYHY